MDILQVHHKHNQRRTNNNVSHTDTQANTNPSKKQLGYYCPPGEDEPPTQESLEAEVM